MHLEATATALGLGTTGLPHCQKVAIMGTHYKPWEYLDYLFPKCNPVGSPSLSLILCYDIDVCPDASTIVLDLDVVGLA